MGRILGFHPDIKTLINEEFILKERNGEKLINVPRDKLSSRLGFDIDRYNWGEKITILNASLPRTGGTILDYTKLWKEYFDPDYKVLWIVRHPVDVILGNYVRKKACGSIKDDKFRLEFLVGIYQIVMPIVFKGLSEANINIGIIKFENILLNPVESLMDIFGYLGLDTDFNCAYNMAMRSGGTKRRWFIQFDKAFNYSSNEVPNIIREVYPEINRDIEFLNDVAPGVKYEY